MERGDQWQFFDAIVTVDAAAWPELSSALAAYDELLRHGQVHVRLEGELADHAEDAAAYLDEVLGSRTIVLEASTSDLLIARRPVPMRRPSDPSGDRAAVRPDTRPPADSVGREPPEPSSPA